MKAGLGSSRSPRRPSRPSTSEGSDTSTESCSSLKLWASAGGVQAEGGEWEGWWVTAWRPASGQAGGGLPRHLPCWRVVVPGQAPVSVGILDDPLVRLERCGREELGAVAEQQCPSQCPSHVQPFTLGSTRSTRAPVPTPAPTHLWVGKLHVSQKRHLTGPRQLIQVTAAAPARQRKQRRHHHARQQERGQAARRCRKGGPACGPIGQRHDAVGPGCDSLRSTLEAEVRQERCKERVAVLQFLELRAQPASACLEAA